MHDKDGSGLTGPLIFKFWPGKVDFGLHMLHAKCIVLLTGMGGLEG